MIFSGRETRTELVEKTGSDAGADELIAFGTFLRASVSGHPTWEAYIEDQVTGAELLELLRLDDVVHAGATRCRACGCTDNFACPGGCSWIAPGLCSRCV